MVFLSCKLQLVCFFFLCSALSASQYFHLSNNRWEARLPLAASEIQLCVCTEKAYCWSVAFFFSPPSIRQSYRKWWVRRKLRMFPPHPLPLLNLLRVKHQSPQRHRYNTRCFCQTWNWHHQHVCQMGDFFLPVASNWKERERKHPTCWGFIKLDAYFFLIWNQRCFKLLHKKQLFNWHVISFCWLDAVEVNYFHSF